jgi:hypothetical protein
VAYLIQEILIHMFPELTDQDLGLYLLKTQKAQQTADQLSMTPI